MAKKGKKSAAPAAARGASKQDKKHAAGKKTSVANSARKNQSKKVSDGREKKPQSLNSGNLSQLVTLVAEQGVAWYDAEPKLKPRLKHKSEAEPLKAADELVLKLKKQAQQLLEAEVARFDAHKSGKMSSDDKYLATMMKSGTLSDRVAALTLTSQASSLHSLHRLGQLITMASKKARRESLMAVDSLKDLFLNNLLPDEAKLRFFHQHPLQAAQDSPAHLVLWFFEHCLKAAYVQLTAVLASGMDDAVDSHKRACLRAANALLRAKPEQEAVLLAMLVNKLGDPDRKIAAYLHRMLQDLLREHPAMKRVVVDEVERLLTRPKVSDRAKYNAVLFLNQIYLEGDGVDADLAGHLISVYFGLFSKEVHRHDEMKEKSKKNAKDTKKGKKKKSAAPTSDEAMDRKLLSALLVGVNRAFPYANATLANFSQEIDSLFQVVHRAHHSTSVQALMLLFQVMSSTNSVSDRFYSALYGKLIDPKVRETSKHTLFLNLIFRAIKADVSPARAGAFTKRLLQLASVMPPAFACAVLFLLSELLKVKLQLRTLLDQPEAGSASGNAADDEHFEDAKTDEETAAFELEKEESDDDEDDTTEDAGSSKLNDGLTDAERSAKVLAQMFGQPEKESKKSKEAAVVSFDDEVAAKITSKKKAGADKEEGGYDASKRNPLFAGAETSCAWEIQMLAHHYHPSVQSFTRQLLDNKDTGIEYSGDPLVDFTMHAFFEKFVNKKPRHKVTEASGNNGAKAKNWTFAPINSEALLQENEANVDASDQFFYKFFKERASRDAENPRRKKTTKNDRDGDALSDEDDEEIDAYAQELAEGIMKDGNHDDEDPDMADWSDSDGEEEPTLEGEDEDMEEAAAMAGDDDEDAGGEEEQEDDDNEDDEGDDEDAFDFSVMGGMDDDDDVLQEELEALEAKRKKQTPPKAGDKRKSLFASADDYDQIVKEAMAKQAEGDKQVRGKKSKKPRRS
ncbi:CCAAT/enhancer-binding protein zeta [Phytophthora fragariae]|uniref:CCAAT/enhancer-binding protein zeta n=1 Tax=Phytophthora fragariae TaxID=53985 RepID=A0A6G0SFZ4_9STRA|nr:CCAAT/enhancer-binding protein zeta [Phytophthora fragariae]